MPKIIKPGVNGNHFWENGFNSPKKPPAGLWGVCSKCHTHFETEEDEPGAKFKTITKKRGGIVSCGWEVPCICCDNGMIYFVCEITTLAYNGIKDTRIQQ